jgi:hypothetical protein
MSYRNTIDIEIAPAEKAGNPVQYTRFIFY